MSARPLERVAGSGDLPCAGEARQYGVLPWRNDRHGNLRILLTAAKGGGRWSVPKGGPVGGRAPYLAAALEAFEAAGVIGETLPHPLASYRWVEEGEGVAQQPLRVSLFGLRVVGTLTNWPQRGQRKRRWFAPAEAADAVGDPDLARIVRAVGDEPHRLVKMENPGGPGSVEDARAGAALPFLQARTTDCALHWVWLPCGAVACRGAAPCPSFRLCQGQRNRERP